MTYTKGIENIEIFKRSDLRNFILESTDWETFVQKLNSLGNDRENNLTKGYAFELLTTLYLLNDPIFRLKIKNIWHHSCIPLRIFDLLDLQMPEVGVDLVAETIEGKLWAIQCKYRSDIEKNLTYDDVESFFSITERPQTISNLSHRIIATSNIEVTKRISKIHKNKLGYLKNEDFAELSSLDFKNFHNILNNEKIIPEQSSTRREHQKKALNKCMQYFNDPKNTRGKIIHPCGSGKSLTGYWFFKDMQASNALIIVPSLQLVRQTLKTWAKELISENIDMEWIAVCSDDDVKKIDDPSIKLMDLGIEVNTNIESIANFLSKKSQRKKIVITTYQSGKVLIQGAKKSQTKFDVGIFDEAHKTVGKRNKPFAQLLYEENILIKKRLFMTATESVYKGNSEEIISMNNEKIYGKIIDSFSFKSALEQKPEILCDYRIISTAIKKSYIKQLIEENSLLKVDGSKLSYETDASSIASAIILQKAVNEFGINHVISFHSKIERAKDFKYLNETINQISSSSKSMSSYHISSKDSTGKRSQTIKNFIFDKTSLITNARCLTEGVDIPIVDAVLFADPKKSTIDIVQAAGRALRYHKDKKLGYIIIPIVVEDVSTNKLQENIFEQIINVVAALGMNDERIIAEFQMIAQGKSKSGRIINIDFESISTDINIKDLYSSIDLKIWDRLSFAKSVIKDEVFVSWLRNSQNLKDKTIKNYLGAINKMTNYFLKTKPEYEDIYELIKNENLNSLKEEWLAVPEHKKLNDDGNKMYSAGFNKFIDYKNEKQLQKL